MLWAVCLCLMHVHCSQTTQCAHVMTLWPTTCGSVHEDEADGALPLHTHGCQTLTRCSSKQVRELSVVVPGTPVNHRRFPRQLRPPTPLTHKRMVSTGGYRTQVV